MADDRKRLFVGIYWPNAHRPIEAGGRQAAIVVAKCQGGDATCVGIQDTHGFATSHVPDADNPIDRPAGKLAAIGMKRHSMDGAAMAGEWRFRFALHDIPDLQEVVGPTRDKPLIIGAEGQRGHRASSQLVAKKIQILCPLRPEMAI